MVKFFCQAWLSNTLDISAQVKFKHVSIIPYFQVLLLVLIQHQVDFSAHWRFFREARAYFRQVDDVDYFVSSEIEEVVAKLIDLLLSVPGDLG